MVATQLFGMNLLSKRMRNDNRTIFDLPKSMLNSAFLVTSLFVDSSQHPYDTIKGTVEAVQSIVPEKGDLLETFGTLKR